LEKSPRAASAKEYLEKVTGKKLVFGQKPGMLDLCDEISPDENTPDDVLLGIIGKALMEIATTREWSAFKWLCGKYGNSVDQAIELRTFGDTHHQRVTKLGGIWEGIKITAKDIARGRKELLGKLLK